MLDIVVRRTLTGYHIHIKIDKPLRFLCIVRVSYQNAVSKVVQNAFLV